MKKNDVISYFGGVSKTAKALGLSHASVSGWTDLIPKGRAFEIQVLTNGDLKVDPALYGKPTEPTAELKPQEKVTHCGQ
ncbi:Cro/CI family transcriptional regulator [Pectobacterium sp. CHL-2024]|uniref:Cro/CI family transcriptional regulator n=1 Tax=Pectobacterium sp. CHL-2024 TaxID=3377079 RepID=UPI0037F46E0A